MRLLDTAQLVLKEFIGGTDTPKYAILSHTWGNKEVTYGMLGRPGIEKMRGYSKIANACQQARMDGYRYIWIDTCCIDKSSSAELSEAINSMFAWYKDAGVCYAYLADVEEKPDPAPDYDKARAASIFQAFPGDITKSPYMRELLPDKKKVHRDQFSASRWFTRGWTLQELIAPSEVIFYSRDWREIARKSQSYDKIAYVTGIDACYLSGDLPIMRASIAERMFWTSSRTTTRPEDIAYCLLGIFDVNMPLLYGEGQKAFLRLQEEILRYSDDHTLFAWQSGSFQFPSISASYECGILAQHPIMFSDSREIVPYPSQEGDSSARMSNIGLELTLQPAWGKSQSSKEYALNCTSKPSCKGFVTIYLRPVNNSAMLHVRTHFFSLGRCDQPQLDGIRLCVSTKHAERLPQQIWPQAELHLKRGPTSYPLVDIVHVQYQMRAAYGTGAQLPYLDKPSRPSSRTRPQSPTGSSISISEQVDAWVPEQFPVIYQLPRGGDLIGVVLEFALPANQRMIVMLGTSSKYDIGLDCMLLDKTDKLQLQDCGVLYDPQEFGQLVPELDGYCVYVSGESTFEEGVHYTNANITIQKTKVNWLDKLPLKEHRMSKETFSNRVKRRRQILDDALLRTPSSLTNDTPKSLGS